MSTLTIQAGGLVVQDPNDSRVYRANWDENLPDEVTLVGVGEFNITPDDGLLVISDEELIDGNRQVQFRMEGGRRGRRYRVAHRIVTDAAAPDTKEQSFYVAVQDR
jgi:hypothetical protein